MSGVINTDSGTPVPIKALNSLEVHIKINWVKFNFRIYLDFLKLIQLQFRTSCV
jgi:hypothetical protein